MIVNLISATMTSPEGSAELKTAGIKVSDEEFIMNHHIRFQELINSNDTFFVYRALLSAAAISIIDERLIRYRMRSGSLVRTRRAAPDCYIKAQAALEKFVTELGLLQDEGFRKSFNIRIKQNTKWNKEMINSAS
ncbi:MAG: hypothetical protein II922_08390 [Succinimonas sp.]|nr:hypothetical protein [Succinimonas sp.]